MKMGHRLNFLSDVVRSKLVPTPAPPPPELGSNPDFVIVLAALCCAILGAVGLVFMARCNCLHQLVFGSATSTPCQPPPPPGLRRKSIQMLPTFRYASSSGSVGTTTTTTTDCPICLTELSEGDLMRILPMCGHVFHVKCIDMWLGSRSSCPSCRQVVLEAAPCRLCGGSQRRPGSCSAAVDDRELGLA